MKKILVFVLALIFPAALAAGPQDVIEEVIVKINDEMISLNDFNSAFAPLEDQLRLQYEGEDLQRRIERYKKEIFNIMVNKKLLEVRFNEMGISVPQSQYQRIIDFFMERTQSQNMQQLEQALADNGLSMEYIRNLAEEQYISRAIFSSELAAETRNMTESHIQEYYEKHADRYSRPEKVDISQIVISFSPAEREVTRAVAQDALDRVRSGEDFDSVYREVSPVAGSDGTASIGTVESTSLRREIKEAIDVLQPGEVSEIVELDSAYLIIRLDDRQEASLIPLEEIRDQVQLDIEEEIVREGLDTIIERFKREFLIEIKSPRFQALYDPNSTARSIPGQL